MTFGKRSQTIGKRLPHVGQDFGIFDLRPEIRRINVGKDGRAALRPGPGEDYMINAIAATGSVDGEIRVYVNDLLAFIAPVASLVYLIEKNDTIHAAHDALREASEAVRRNVSFPVRLTTELLVLSRAIEGATLAWTELCAARLGPLDFGRLSFWLSREHDCRIELHKGNTPVELDLFMTVRRATTTGA